MAKANKGDETKAQQAIDVMTSLTGRIPARFTVAERMRLILQLRQFNISQMKVATAIGLGNRQATVSEYEIVLHWFSFETINRLDTKITITMLARFVSRCDNERTYKLYKKESPTPALECLEKFKASKGTITESMFLGLGAKPILAWWRKKEFTLLTLANDPRFKAAYPDIAVLLGTVAKYKSLAEWLAAIPNPTPKTGVTKAEK